MMAPYPLPLSIIRYRWSPTGPIKVKVFDSPAVRVAWLIAVAPYIEIVDERGDC